MSSASSATEQGGVMANQQAANGNANTNAAQNGHPNGHANGHAQNIIEKEFEHVKEKRARGWRRVVRNFTPSWFAVNMGTGIVSILFHSLPYTEYWLSYIAWGFFGLNVILFCIFLILSILRYILYPQIWIVMIKHPAQSLFLGCFPMAIINMMVLACKPWGDWVIWWAWGLWWLDVAISLATCLLVPFIVSYKHRPALHQTSAAMLLPVVPAVVASASGGIIAEALPNERDQITTLLVSYCLWGLGECFTGVILALYFHRITIHSMPAKEVIVSVFLPMGPLGQGGFGIQKLGSVALKVLPKSGVLTPLAGSEFRGGDVFYVFGVIAGLAMWGFACGWLCFAVFSIATTKRFPFNMGWWGFTFPIGVFTTCTISLGDNLSSSVFHVLGEIFCCVVFLLWTLVAGRTLQLACTREIFVAPCLGNLEEKPRKRHRHGRDPNMDVEIAPE
ncbi:putative C4-dicarboxylate transporter/malic acid transport protein [Xylariomycetidae sp. FL0641]|nr:putative C4-dicarboxylate transporter/malic acid transport protein [Xylariomycetidae sp. FL0641]